MKKRKLISLLPILICLPIVTGCNADKDKNGKDDREESQGTYWINVPGYEDQRNEAITISEVKDESHGKIAGSIYSKTSNKVYTFNLQDVQMASLEEYFLEELV